MISNFSIPTLLTLFLLQFRLVVLAFPCNSFGSQEPGTDAAILAFCTKSYGVTFPIMKKSEVNGANANSVFKFLKGPGGSNIGWNFEVGLLFCSSFTSFTTDLQR